MNKGILLLSMPFFFSCQSNITEEIIGRYSNGQKKMVLVYKNKGQGKNEQLMERWTYTKEGKLFTFENLVNGTKEYGDFDLYETSGSDTLEEKYINDIDREGNVLFSTSKKWYYEGGELFRFKDYLNKDNDKTYTDFKPELKTWEGVKNYLEMGTGNEKRWIFYEVNIEDQIGRMLDEDDLPSSISPFYSMIFDDDVVYVKLLKDDDQESDTLKVMYLFLNEDINDFFLVIKGNIQDTNLKINPININKCRFSSLKLDKHFIGIRQKPFTVN